jgi:hypothetical protein
VENGKGGKKMALTDYDKKKLSDKDQKQIEFLTKVYDNAKAKGDTKTMNDAASKASTIRNNAGYTSDASGNYSGTYSPTSSGTKTNASSGGNSQYTQYTPNSGYTIGSQLGLDVAQKMPINGQYEASDGSIWTKEQDGTITVRTKNGQTIKNAHTPSDYSITLQQMMDAGVPYQNVQNVLGSRVNKALTTEGLGQYAYDDMYYAAMDYINNARNAENKQNSQKELADYMNAFMNSYPRPTAPQRDPRIEQQLNAILNRDDFSYDVTKDPLYEQYAKMYQREGDRAMRDTLAEAATSAGGMNTYAITAAQQAQNYYNSQLGDKIPELYQLAYSMYLDDKESMVQDLGLLNSMDESQYGRYRDTMNDWRNDRDFAYGSYWDAMKQSNWQNNFDYNAMVGNRDFAYKDFWDNQKWGEENSRYDTENAKADVQYYIGMGVKPNENLIKKADMNIADVQKAVAQKNKPTSTGTTSSSSKSNNTSAKKEAIDQVKWYVGMGVMPKKDLISQADMDYDDVVAAVEAKNGGTVELQEDGEDTADYTIQNTHDESSVTVAGYGRVSYQELYELVESGKVVEEIDETTKTVKYKKS